MLSKRAGEIRHYSATWSHKDQLAATVSFIFAKLTILLLPFGQSEDKGLAFKTSASQTCNGHNGTCSKIYLCQLQTRKNISKCPFSKSRMNVEHVKNVYDYTIVWLEQGEREKHSSAKALCQWTYLNMLHHFLSIGWYFCHLRVK